MKHYKILSVYLKPDGTKIIRKAGIGHSRFNNVGYVNNYGWILIDFWLLSDKYRLLHFHSFYEACCFVSNDFNNYRFKILIIKFKEILKSYFSHLHRSFNITDFYNLTIIILLLFMIGVII